MKLEGSVALVTGANRGLGRAFARELVRRGASTVYAGARDPSAVTDPGLTPVGLDVTDPGAVRAAAERCTDVTLLINNAGVMAPALAAAARPEDARAELEVNYLGTLAVSQAFAPVLAANGGGAVANMLSALSLITSPRASTYAASKAAEWSITNALRIELRGQGTRVAGIYCGYIDTDMISGLDVPKLDPEHVARVALDGVAAGDEEIFVDDVSRYVKANLADDLERIYPAIQQQHDASYEHA